MNVRAHYRKFITAETGDGIRLSNRRPEAPSDGAKEFIPHRVAERVVHIFEMVKVE
jgi:hypothetical protein